mgnify:CR=1 FL=1
MLAAFAKLGPLWRLLTVLGGIGVASAMNAYMARKSDAVAVLRCIGATSRQVFGIYLLQAAVMGLAGGFATPLLVGWLNRHLYENIAVEWLNTIKPNPWILGLMTNSLNFVASVNSVAQVVEVRAQGVITILVFGKKLN